jgi:hypothetical protein
VEASNQVADLLHRAADVAVRMTRPVQQSLVAIKAGEIEIGLYATENYLTRRGGAQPAWRAPPVTARLRLDDAERDLAAVP